MEELPKIIFDSFRHFFPELKFSEAQVYACLFSETKKTSERIILETNLSRATVFSSLKSLIQKGMIAKSEFFPVEYFAINPKKVFSSNLLKINSKLRSYKKKLFLSSEKTKLFSEFILTELRGEKKILSKHSKKEISDSKKLSEIREALELALKNQNKKLSLNNRAN